MANESPAESEDLSESAKADNEKAEDQPKPRAARKPRAKAVKAESRAASDDPPKDEEPAAKVDDPVVDEAEVAEKKPAATAKTDGAAKADGAAKTDGAAKKKPEDDDADDAKDGKEPDDADEDDDEPEVSKVPEKKRSRWRDLLGVLICVAVVLFARASLIDHYVVPTGSMEPTVGIDDRVIVFKAAYGLRIPNTQTWLLRWGGPKRGDVVVLESPPQPAGRTESADPGGTILLKRVIGLPGDTVMVRDGKISVNGDEMQLDPPTNGDATHYVEDPTGKQHFVSVAIGGGPTWGPTQLPDGKSPIADCTKIGQDPKSDTPTAAVPPRMYLVMGDNRGNSKDGRIFGCVKEDAILGHAVKIYYSKGLSWKDL